MLAEADDSRVKLFLIRSRGLLGLLNNEEAMNWGEVQHWGKI